MGFFVEHHICATALYLLFILLHYFNIIIERGISAQGHYREVLDGINATDKGFILRLMAIW